MRRKLSKQKQLQGEQKIVQDKKIHYSLLHHNNINIESRQKGKWDTSRVDRLKNQKGGNEGNKLKFSSWPRWNNEDQIYSPDSNNNNRRWTKYTKWFWRHKISGNKRQWHLSQEVSPMVEFPSYSTEKGTSQTQKTTQIEEIEPRVWGVSRGQSSQNRASEKRVPQSVKGLLKFCFCFFFSSI